jgi:hypothetical protein
MRIAYVLLSVALAGAASLAATPRAAALPTNTVRYAYYEDDTFTNQIGFELIMTCSGRPYNPTLIGQRSDYIVESYEPCSSPQPIEIQCMIDGRQTYCPINICQTYGVC